MDIIDKMHADAEYHRQVASDCDCRPEDTANWVHANNCMEAAGEVMRLRALLRHYANWIEDIYGQLPSDKAPGPPRMLLQKMREDALPPRSP